MFNFNGLFKNFFKKRDTSQVRLEDFVKQGLLTNEEVLRIKRDRAIVDWEMEKERLKKKPKK